MLKPILKLSTSGGLKATTVNINRKFLLRDRIALDGAELIPIDCGGRLSAPSITVNELGKQLMKASAEGNVEETKLLLDRGALFSADWLGTTPLHLAAKNNHLEVCKELLRAGISRDARTKVDKTPLHMAAFAGYVDIVEMLLEHGADPECQDLLGMTALHWAAQNGHTDVVCSLLKHFAQSNPVNKFELTPADLAAQAERFDIVELIHNGAEEPDGVTQQLTYQLQEENSDESSFQISEHLNQSTSNSPIPLETILLEGNETSIDPEKLHINATDEIDDETIEQNHDNFAESIKLLQEHGITMLPTHDDNNILTTAMETGHSVVLTDVGKEVLNSLKESEGRENENINAPLKNRIMSMTSGILAMTNNKQHTNILKQINGRLVSKNVKKRVVMRKNKIGTISSAVNNVFKNNKFSCPSDKEIERKQFIKSKDFEELQVELYIAIEERDFYKEQTKLRGGPTIEEYKAKTFSKEHGTEHYKEQVRLLLRRS